MVKSTIRDATEADVHLLVTYQQNMARETENLKLDAEVLKSGILHLLQNPSSGKYFVIEVEGKVVGCMMVTYEWSDWRNKVIFWIQSVYVEENFRNKGVFKRLYEYLKHEVETDPSVGGIRLYVERNNLLAKEVYQRLGMSGDHYELFEWME